MVDRDTAADQEISALIRRHAVRHAAPIGLADRIADSLQATARPTQISANSSWRSLAMAASLLLAIGLSSGVTWFFAAADRQESLAQQVVASHVRSMLGGDHLTDVASSDQHTVKPWFGGKLDLSPPVVDLTSQGFPLVGGRLDYLDRRPVAALVYRHSQHVINLFIWPDKASPVAAPSSLQGYHLRQWRQGDLTFWAVSDVNPADLENFERILQAATR
jgi:anti-sigma factor RsiW